MKRFFINGPTVFCKSLPTTIFFLKVYLDKMSVWMLLTGIMILLLFCCRSNLNVFYDHGMDHYTGRLAEGKDFVEAKDLNQLYIDENILSQPEMV